MKIMIDRCLPRYREIKDKDFYYIITAADPQHYAADETITRLKERLADYDTQTELAASTDFPDGE